jgi:hypothetical protein
LALLRSNLTSAKIIIAPKKEKEVSSEKLPFLFSFFGVRKKLKKTYIQIGLPI